MVPWKRKIPFLVLCKEKGRPPRKKHLLFWTLPKMVVVVVVVGGRGGWLPNHFRHFLPKIKAYWVDWHNYEFLEANFTFRDFLNICLLEESNRFFSKCIYFFERLDVFFVELDNQIFFKSIIVSITINRNQFHNRFQDIPKLSLNTVGNWYSIVWSMW